MRTRHLTLVLASLGLLAAAHCSGTPSDGAATSDPEALGSCSLAVTKNTYDGPDYWGTISVKNGTGASVTGFDVSFAVPSGAACTTDYVPSGATLTTSSNHCTFTWKTTKIASGATFTFNYSTGSTSFSSASGVTAKTLKCSGGSDAGTGTDAGGHTDSGTPSRGSRTWRGSRGSRR
jgi:chitosanase